MSNLKTDAEWGLTLSTAERVAALKRIVPHAAISTALNASHRVHAPCRRLPRELVVWFVIAMALFHRDSYRQVYRWLCRYQPNGTPGRSTLCEARHSVGVAPLRRLAEQVIQPLAQPETPHAFYHGMRLMGVDGFVVDVPDSPANERAFGRPGGRRSPGAFPQVRVLSLCELGTHVLWKSLIKPQRRGEAPMALYLSHFLQENMLLLADRNFLSYVFVKQVLQQQAHLLVRIKKNLVFEPIKHLPDGSYLAKLYRSPRHRQRDKDGIVVRIIDYTFEDPGRPGSGETHRLLTTLLSAREHPAKNMIELYHERWEEEGTIDELKTHLREHPVLHSQTPAGVVQELYGLLLGHYVIRQLMFDAAQQAAVAPRSISFVNTLKILRCRLAEAPRQWRGLTDWYESLVSEVSAEVLEPRRDRVNPRVIKRKMSGWLKKRPKHRNFPQPTKKFCRSIVILD